MRVYWSEVIPHFKAVLLAVLYTSPMVSGRRIRLNNPRNAAIVKLNIDPWSPNGYKFGFQTSFGSSRSESGYLKTSPEGRRFLVTKGEFSYFGPDGKFYKVKYVADENGYRPIDHSLAETTRSRLVPAAVDNDYFAFPDEDLTSSPPVTTFSSTSSPSVFSSTEPGPPGSNSTQTVIEVPINATLGDRFGLPPGLVGSLLG